MKKIGIFLDEIKDQTIDDTQKFSKLGSNTGNMLFWHSLKAQLKLDVRSRWYIDHIEKLNLSEYKAFITTDLIWIRQMQDLSYLNKTLDVIGDLPLIPISIGLQCNSYMPDFKMHPETVKLIQRLSERCTMGVRGSYTAEILDKYGITNFKVVGCPSMYLAAAGIDTVSAPTKPINNVSVNFETFYSKLSPAKIDFLLYCAEHGYEFVEQTQIAADSRHIPDAEKLRQIEGWLSEKKHCFFDIAQWREYMRKFDFSMGTRFHGNVLALWENVPALFLTCDSRTRELCEHFSLPTLDINAFDRSKPIEHYYEMADYERFHKQYPQRLREWEEFLEMNGIGEEVEVDNLEINKTEKKKALYHCFTAYQFLELIIHKQLFHKDDFSVLLVSGDFKKLVPQLDSFVNQKFFNKVIYVYPNKGLEPTNSDSEKDIKNYFDSIFESNGLNYKDFDNIIIAGAYRNFGVYASLMRIPFSIFEDASGALTLENQYNFDKKNDEKMAELINHHGLYFGNGRFIEAVYCDLKNQKNEIAPDVYKKVIDFVVPEQFKKLEDEQQERILSIYNCPKGAGDDLTIIFTQWFIFNNSICKDKRIILHYQYLYDIFSKDDNVMIKTHPADPLDYTGKFSDCIISTSKYPSELIKCCKFNVRKVISINSSANNAFSEAINIKLEQNPFIPIEIYNKLIIVGGLLKIFPELDIKCYGITEQFVEKVYHYSFKINKSVSWLMPIQQPEHSILIIDYLNWGKGTSINELPSIIKNMPCNSIYVFLNRPSAPFETLELNELLDYAVPIVINSEKIKSDVIYDNFQSEVIWAFTRNDEFRNKLRQFQFESILKQVGIKLKVNYLNSNEERIIKNEERLKTVTKTLLKLMEEH